MSRITNHTKLISENYSVLNCTVYHQLILYFRLHVHCSWDEAWGIIHRNLTLFDPETLTWNAKYMYINLPACQFEYMSSARSASIHQAWPHRFFTSSEILHLTTWYILEPKISEIAKGRFNSDVQATSLGWGSKLNCWSIIKYFRIFLAVSVFNGAKKRGEEP